MLAAICDDHNFFRKEIADFLIKFKTERRIHLDIMEFPGGKELLESNEIFDIVFLDYEMPNLNGIDTAKILRERNNFCTIIYITSYPEHVFEAFEVSTYRFLTKPLDYSKLTNAIDDFIKDKKMMSPITVNVDYEQITINSEDIIYLEAEGKYCNIRTQDKFVRSSKTMAQVFQLLPNHCFYRTHKSYAVNFYCISSIKDNLITLNNGEKVAISRNKAAEFKKAYKNFIKHYITRI